MDPNITTSFLRHGLSVPIVSILASWGLLLQERIWRRYPEITVRLSNFLPIGGFCSLLQVLFLASLEMKGVDTLIATAIAVFFGTFTNYVLNRAITWRDRFNTMTKMEKWVSFLPLYLVFALTTFMNLVKIVGVPVLEHIGLPATVALVMLEIIGAIANFIGADKITFGITTKAIKQFSRS